MRSNEFTKAAALIHRLGGRITAGAFGRRSWTFRDCPWAMLQTMADRGMGRWENKPAGAKGGRSTRVFVLDDGIDETGVPRLNVEFPPATSLNLLGGVRGGAVRGEPTFDSINICRPGDLALVHRAVGGGWDVPQHVRDALCEQFTPALQKYTDTMRNGATPSARHRAMKHLLKMVMLGARMTEANRIAEGLPRGYSPLLRKRYPEKRKPRHRPTTLEESVERLEEQRERREARDD
jgi:hypothetical protein